MPNKNLWDILKEHEATDGAPGVQGGPPHDPKMLPAEKDGDAKFVAAHMHARGTKRITDIDASTLDDKLFNATNITRSVPEAGKNRHGHVPTGKDAVAYKKMSEGLKPINDPNSSEYDPRHPTNDPKTYSATPYAAHAVQADRDAYNKRKGIKENTNSGEDDLKQAKQVDSNSKDDMDAFDQLGPRTRAVLNDKMPVKWSSAKTLDMMKQRNMDPMHPQVDSQLASQLAAHGQAISNQLHVEGLLEEVSQTVKKAEREKQLKKMRLSEGDTLIAEAIKSGKSAKPADRRTGYPDDQDCEACHDRTLAFHDKALGRAKAEMYGYGMAQDFGPDKSSIMSKTSLGKLTTEHDHGSGRITHSWEENK